MSQSWVLSCHYLRDRSLITTWGVGKLDTRMRQIFRLPLMPIMRKLAFPLREYAENLGSPPHNKRLKIGISPCLHSYSKELEIMCKNKDYQW